MTGDTNGVPDIFLYDRLTNLTTCLSVNRFGTAAGDNRSLAPVFSGDGQTLVFQSWASDLVAQDFNQSSDLFAYALVFVGGRRLSSPPRSSPARGPGQGPWLMWPVVPGQELQCAVQGHLARRRRGRPLNGSVTILGKEAYFNDPRLVPDRGFIVSWPIEERSSV